MTSEETPAPCTHGEDQASLLFKHKVQVSQPRAWKYWEVVTAVLDETSCLSPHLSSGPASSDGSPESF